MNYLPSVSSAWQYVKSFFDRDPCCDEPYPPSIDPTITSVTRSAIFNEIDLDKELEKSDGLARICAIKKFELERSQALKKVLESNGK